MSDAFNKNKMDVEITNEVKVTVVTDDTNRFDEAVSDNEPNNYEDVHMSALNKILNIVIAPEMALRAIKTKPTILLVMLVLPWFSLLYYILFWQSYEVQIIQMMEQQFVGMGMELTREILELQLKILRYTTPIGAVIGTYFGVLLASVFYYIIGKLLKTSVTFKQTFSMLLHASIISSLIWVLHMVVTTIVGESNILEPMTSLVSFLPDSMYGTVIYGLILPFEVFSLWYMFVLFLGLIITCGYTKKAAGITIAVTMLVTMLLSASSFMLQNLASGL